MNLHAATAAVAPGTEEPTRHKSGAALALAALGVVFGDIGTSPLYSLQTVFAAGNGAVTVNEEDVLGVISMVLWAVTLIVSFKYVSLVMRADNDGEGGILSLVALLRDRVSSRARMTGLLIVLGMVGAALFYGDSMITPAISVMSAVEGLHVINPDAERFVLPASVIILTLLFLVQRLGTGRVGHAFGPIMALWFCTIATLGVPWIAQYPDILRALSPHHAILFALDRPGVAFIAMGAIVLAITGAEALYADMGHFGASAIRKAWVFVFTCLLLNYLGQGAMLLHHPDWVSNPFFLMAPSWATLPLVILATVATVIASQAVIAGAFSVTRQAGRLRLLPRLAVRHTSREEEGQIYIGTVNWILFVGVLLLIAIFQSSAALASAYGVAVTGTELLTSTCFLLLARHVWKVRTWKLVVYVLFVFCVEIVFFSATLVKIASGGWIPLVIAGLALLVMTTWRQGVARMIEERRELEGPIEDFLERVAAGGYERVPGLAVYPHPDARTVPLALRQNLRFNHVLHQHVVLVTIQDANIPHVRHVNRITVDNLGGDDDGIVGVTCRVGFNDSQDIPKALALAIGCSPELDVDPDEALYYLSVLEVDHGGAIGLRTWRRQLFHWLVGHQSERTRQLHLPPDRTVIMGARVDL